MLGSEHHCIIGLFDRREDALAAQQELLGLGFDVDDITLTDRPATGAPEPGFWTRVKEFFGAEDVDVYTEASRRGGTLLECDVHDRLRIDQVKDVLERHHVVDVDKRAAEWRQSGWLGSTSSIGASSGLQSSTLESGSADVSIPVTEEQLKIGKRREQRGGVRIYSRVIETPVQEDITLRDERVHVERRAVDRPATGEPFKEQVIEATEMHEEPVVMKEARVVEEVVLGKDVTERTETIKDTVRRTDVEIDTRGLATDLEADFRKDFDTRYASSGVSYDLYRPAYDYGRQLADYEAYRDRDWDAIELQAREGFEKNNPGMWERFKDAVRGGFERSRARRVRS